MKRMLIGISVFIALLVTLALTGRKSVHHEVVVNAPASAVWKALRNTKDYPDWNPVMEVVAGQVIEGQEVTYAFTQSPGQTTEIKAQVKQVLDQQRLAQAGGIIGVLTFDHSYTLEAQGERCKVIIHEDYRGIGVHFWNPAPVEQAYGRLNQALRERAEDLHRNE